LFVKDIADRACEKLNFHKTVIKIILQDFRGAPQALGDEKPSIDVKWLRSVVIFCALGMFMCKGNMDRLSPQFCAGSRISARCRSLVRDDGDFLGGCERVKKGRICHIAGAACAQDTGSGAVKRAAKRVRTS
jgi:hypothetical protein